MMSTESSGTDILDTYKQISNKLKKRFLRKPNVTEACDSFTLLGQRCETNDMPSYAGMCWIAAARCEGSLGNISGESSCLVRSARNFILGETKNKNLGCSSVSNPNLQAALGCYAHACTRLPESSHLITGITLEIVDSLRKMDKKDLTETYLKKAVDFSNQSLDVAITCLESLAAYNINNGNYMAALDTLTCIVNLLADLPLNGSRADILLKCHISRIFLLIILRPTPHKLPLPLVELLETFTWGDKNLNAYCISEELFLLLQSLVITCQSLDKSNLSYLEGCLWPHLNTDQRSLLRSLVLLYS